MREFLRIICSCTVGIVMMTSCFVDSEGEDSTSNLRGDKYIGNMLILGTTQTDIVFYADLREDGNVIDILMPGVSFMPGLMPSLDMALVDIPLTSLSPAIYGIDESQMVTIYDGLPLLNDVIQGISDINIEIVDDNININFNCSISTDAMGDMTVAIVYQGVKNI